MKGQFNFRINEETLFKLGTIAKKENTSKSAIIRYLIDEYYEKHI